VPGELVLDTQQERLIGRIEVGGLFKVIDVGAITQTDGRVAPAMVAADSTGDDVLPSSPCALSPAPVNPVS